MRSDKEILEMIISFAKRNNNIRMVCMNGSRVNEKITPDQYQDFDVVYIVNDLYELTRDLRWIEKFGETIIKQFPDNQELFPSSPEGYFHILMLFDDYKRIDLTLVSKNKKSEYLNSESLIKVLLNKDCMFDDVNPSNDSKHWIKRPSQKMFDECINEFYWVSTYVMKGVWRNELLYAHDHLNICRNMLLLMIAWNKAFSLHYRVNFGKSYKFLDNHLSHSEKVKLIATFPSLHSDEIKSSLYKMINFFDENTKSVGDQCALYYNVNQYEEVKTFIGY